MTFLGGLAGFVLGLAIATAWPDLPGALTYYALGFSLTMLGLLIGRAAS